MAVLAIVGLVSCNSGRDKITIKDEKGNKATIDLGAIEEMTKVAEASQDKAEELKKLTPLTIDQLKAMVPEEFMGMKRSNFNANSMMGAANVTATYKSDDGKEIRLDIFDCAGEYGSGIYSLRYWTLWNYEREDDNGYQKTVDFDGQKAIEEYQKHNDQYSLTYFAKDRLLVKVEGEKIGIEGVRQAAKNLQLDVK